MNHRVSSAVRLALTLSSGLFAAAGAGWAQGQPGAPEAVQVPENQTEDQEAADGGVDEIIVIGRQRSAATDVITERIEQEVVADFLAAEQISRVGDSSVSLALRRLPGVTLVNDQFIYVRGLGERYSSTTLNGANVPSPDLTRNVIPLDLFPSAIISSLAVLKGFTADMPAAFGGGSVDIRTLSIPEEPTLSFKVAGGWNSESSDDRLTYPGGSDDWLGTDDGKRELPQSVVDAIQTYQGELDANSILAGLRDSGGLYTLADAEAINRQLASSLNRDVDIDAKGSTPDVGLEAVAGNSWYFGSNEDWRLGVLGLVDYGNQWRNKERVSRKLGAPDIENSITRQTTNQVSMTGSLNIGLAFTEDHSIDVNGLYLRNTDDEASIATGNNGSFLRADGRQFRTYQTRYEERALELIQIRGRHQLGPDTLGLTSLLSPLEFLEGLTFTWYYSDATATTDIPNEVSIAAIDVIDPQSGQLLSTGLRPSNTTADYRFTDLEDKVQSGGWELSMPFVFDSSELQVSGGWERYEKGRGYLQSQLGLGTSLPNTSPLLSGTPGQVLTDANILNPANLFALSIGGVGTESYLAAEIVNASYVQFDFKWNDAWRVAGGVRYEDFQQLSVPVDQYQFDTGVGKIPLTTAELTNLAKAEDDFYPTLALTHMRRDFWAEEFQFRFGWSQTTARPDLREISNATYIDPITDARVSGNPDLKTSAITNFDLRGEWFFGSGDNFTVSAFYKDIADPIEAVEGPGSDDNFSLSFVNAESAEVYGIEVEWLKAAPLGEMLGAWGNDLFVSGNITLSDSEISLGSTALNLTNDTRRLAQHSQYVVNLQLGYDAPSGRHSTTLIYNTVGERVYFAGLSGAPDAYEQPFNSLDWTYSFYPNDLLTFKLRVQNLLSEDVEIEQGNVTILEQSLGTSFKVDATLKF